LTHCGHHIRPSVESAEFVGLMERASAVIKAKIGRGEQVHIVASGGKRAWTDALAVGDVAMRELVRRVGLDNFVPSPGATATIVAEASSKSVEDAATLSAKLLRSKYHHPGTAAAPLLGEVAIVAAPAVASRCEDAFRATFHPACPAATLTRL